MGSGSYSQVIYGIASLKEHNKHIDENRWDDLLYPKPGKGDGILFDDFNLRTSYEGEGDYVGIQILSTLNDTLCIGTATLAEIPGRLLKSAMANGNKYVAAMATWKIFQSHAAKLEVTVPDGALLWVDDYD